MGEKNGGMSRDERERAILRFLSERDVALPPKPLYENLVLKEGITFSRRTVQRLMSSMHDEGLLVKLDISGGYYEISGLGERYLAGEITKDDLRDGDGD